MRARPVGLLIVALAAGCGGGAALPGPGGSASPSPDHPATPPAFVAGGPWRYRYDRLDSIITTLPNGGRQLQIVERHVQLRWETTHGTAGLQVRISLDSVDLVGMPGGLGRGMEDSARGSVIQFGLAPDGVVTGPTVAPENTVGRALTAELPWIIPALPQSLTPGTARADTLASTVRFGVLDLAERTARTTRVGEAIGGFDMSGTVTRDGVSPQLHLTGSGDREARVELAPPGWLRAATGRDSLAMTATVEAIGQSVLLTQISHYSLTALP